MITFNGVPLALIGHAMRAARVAYYDTGKWKMDGDKLALDASGNPIWIGAEGKEQSVGGDTITRLNGEAMGHRTRAEAAEAKVKLFTDAGITADEAGVKAAKEAIEVASNVKNNKLIDAGKIDEVREEVKKSYDSKLTEATTKAANFEAKYNGVLVAGQFGQSKFIGDKLTIPGDMAQAMFGNRFKLDGDKVVAMKADGSGPIYSTARAGELATFDEALEVIVGEYPNRDKILKGGNGSGSGNGGNGGNTGGKKVVKRAEFDKLPFADQQKVVAESRAGTASIED